MKKLAILALSVFLTACSWGNFVKPKPAPENPAVSRKAETKISAEKILHDEYIKTKIKSLENQIEAGKITKEEAQERLKQEIIDLQNLNNGSTRSILKKIEMTDPQTAKMLEEKIRQYHPEALEE